MTRHTLVGRTAMVTGGGGGIGRACARALAEQGALVHVVDVDPRGAEDAAAEVGGVAHVADLTDPDAVDALPAKVDVLVNNAGVQHVAPLTEFPPETFERLHRVMVHAPFLLIRQVLPHMYAGGWGRVVNISSVHGARASAFKAGYVAAKHALEGLSKVAAIEGAPHGVTSNCVSPGYVRTPMVENQIAAQAARHHLPEDDVVERVLLDRVPHKELIDPDDVASMVVWLAGPHAAHVTGASLRVDGGWSAT